MSPLTPQRDNTPDCHLLVECLDTELYRIIHFCV